MGVQQLYFKFNRTRAAAPVPGQSYIFVSVSASFSTKYLDTPVTRVLPSTERNINVASQWQHWLVTLDFWQTQLNFAMWCITISGGITILHRTADIFLSRKLPCLLPEKKHPSLDKCSITDWWVTKQLQQNLQRQCLLVEFDLDPKSRWRLNRRTDWLEDLARYLLVLVLSYRHIYASLRQKQKTAFYIAYLIRPKVLHMPSSSDWTT